MLGVTVIIILSVISQLYTIILAIRHKQIYQKYLTLDILEIVSAIILTLIGITEKYTLFGYFLISLIVFIFLKQLIFSITFNLNIIKNHILFFSILAIIVIIAIGFTALFIYNETKHERAFIPITNTGLAHLQNDTYPNKTYIIYIGKPDCNACKQTQPRLEEILLSRHLQAYYYDTKAAQEENETQMYKLLENYNVVVVPSIVILYGDGSHDTITGSDIIDQFVNTSLQLNIS